MDAITLLKTQKRICESYGGCDGCPLIKENTGRGTPCFWVKSDKDYEEYIGIVEKWMKENPVKTRQNLFLEKFPYANVYDGTLIIKPCYVDYGLEDYCYKYEDCLDCKRAYWNEEVEVEE